MSTSIIDLLKLTRSPVATPILNVLKLIRVMTDREHRVDRLDTNLLQFQNLQI